MCRTVLPGQRRLNSQNHQHNLYHLRRKSPNHRRSQSQSLRKASRHHGSDSNPRDSSPLGKQRPRQHRHSCTQLRHSCRLKLGVFLRQQPQQFLPQPTPTLPSWIRTAQLHQLLQPSPHQQSHPRPCPPRQLRRCTVRGPAAVWAQT